MKSLQTIQKTARIFQILVKIGFIFSIIGASVCAVGALCSVAWYSGGRVLSLFGQPVPLFGSMGNIRQTLAELLSEVVLLSAEAILLCFAGQYFKIEQADGTPFTARGAELLRKLGIRCIYVPIVAMVITSVISVCLDTDTHRSISNLPSLTTGLILILASLIFRYGAELEQRNAPQLPDGGVNPEGLT